jgi:hypothetical protein
MTELRGSKRPTQAKTGLEWATGTMLSSKYGVTLPSLLSLRPAFRWVSCDILRYS